jgi:hypothetical protein
MRGPIQIIGAVVIGVVLPLTAAGSCGAVPTADRQGPNGTQPDNYQDMQHVTVYRAPDTVPNVATFCIGQFGFITTLKAGSADGSVTAPSMVRFTELDSRCKG